MLKIISMIGSMLFFGMIVSIYTLDIPATDNSMIYFNSFRNKKILLVNTASNSNYVSQLAGLQQLYVDNIDSLVVIAFPSNSFGNEPKSNAEIRVSMQQDYGVTFPIAGKTAVKGDTANVIYKWLQSKMQNDKTDAKIVSDFQKYLINERGVIMAVFDSATTMTAISIAIHNQ